MSKPGDQTVDWILASSIIPRWQVMRNVCGVCARVRVRVPVTHPLLTHTAFVCVNQMYPFMRFKGHFKVMCADASHLCHQRVTEDTWTHHVWTVSVFTLNLIISSRAKTLNTPRLFSLQRLGAVMMMMMSRAAQIYNNITHLHACMRADNNARAYWQIHRCTVSKRCERRQKDTPRAHRRPHSEKRRVLKGGDRKMKVSGVARTSAQLGLNISYLGSKWSPKLWSTKLAWFSRAHSDSSPRLCFPEKTPSIPPDWVIWTEILFESWEWKEPNIQMKTVPLLFVFLLFPVRKISLHFFACSVGFSVCVPFPLCALDSH